MLIFPAIDLYEGQAVRLYKGDYARRTVYSENPLSVAEDFVRSGATHIHLVDLEGAKSGATPNLERILSIKRATGLFCEVGGGVRSMDVVRRYVDAGIDRVILGTAAVTDRAFVEEAVRVCGDAIAVGVDIRDGMVAIKGWTEQSSFEASDFLKDMKSIGVNTFIVTDISKDGAMLGANHALYAALSRIGGVNLIASGGVSSMDDVRALREMNLYGAIVGKAYYTGAIALAEAIQEAGRGGATI